MGPRERYLVGMLGPKHAPKSTVAASDELPDTESGVQGGGEAALPEVVTSQNLGRIWASSMGLSFAVAADVDVLLVTVTWGRYGRQETEDVEGKKRTAWVRDPTSHELEVRLDGEPADRIPLTGTDVDQPGVDVRPRDGQRVVRLVLVNAQQEPESNADTAWLFRSCLTVTALDRNAAIFVPVDDLADGGRGAGQDDAEETHLRLLYRHYRRSATGHNISVHPHVRDGDRRTPRHGPAAAAHHDRPAACGEGARLRHRCKTGRQGRGGRDR